MTRDEQKLEKRLVDLSRTACQRNMTVYSDFLNLNELNILHSVPKDKLYSSYIAFGGYDTAERQMAAFVPDALYLRGPSEKMNPQDISFPFSVLCIWPVNAKFAEELTHRDYLGSLLSLGIDRSRVGDILTDPQKALVFVRTDLSAYIKKELTRIRHTSVRVSEEDLKDFCYQPGYDEIKGSVASVRLDSLIALAFASSRSRLSGLVESGRVFVNGRLATSNSYHVKEGDIISVRGMGKFQYKGIVSRTKKDRNLILIHKYSQARTC